MPLTFWLEGHAVSSEWYDLFAWQRLRTSPYFQSPAHVALLASWHPEVSERFARVDVGSLAATHEQAGAFLALYGGCNARLPSFHAGQGRIGLGLGHHWMVIPGHLDRYLERRDRAAADVFAQYCEAVLPRFLTGDDAEVAARVLDSVPGIRGELRAHGRAR